MAVSRPGNFIDPWARLPPRFRPDALVRIARSAPMFPILEAHFLAPEIKRFTIEAPRIAKKRKAGQFVILRLHAHGERIPLTIADSDPGRGTIDIIVQGIGKTTKLLNMLGAGDAILDLVGPLGKPSDIELYGTVVVIGGGV